MILLNSTSDLIQIITSAAGDVDVQASYVDLNGSTVTPGRTNVAAISTATTTTVVGSPGSGTTRNIKHLSIHNESTSVQQTIQIGRASCRERV